jgi:hypothetical protein
MVRWSRRISRVQLFCRDHCDKCLTFADCCQLSHFIHKNNIQNNNNSFYLKKKVVPIECRRCSTATFVFLAQILFLQNNEILFLIFLIKLFRLKTKNHVHFDLLPQEIQCYQPKRFHFPMLPLASKHYYTKSKNRH